MALSCTDILLDDTTTASATKKKERKMLIPTFVFYPVRTLKTTTTDVYLPKSTAEHNYSKMSVCAEQLLFW